MARVFISHSSRDQDEAALILEWLRAQGFIEAFLDFDKHSGIAPGSEWERTLYREISSAEALILLLSRNWFDSKWCFVEFTQARALGKTIFPVIVDPELNVRVAEDLQHVDLTKDRTMGLQRLASAMLPTLRNARGGFSWDGSRKPFPGLLAFDEADAAIYFGRDDETRHLIERLNARRAQGGAQLLVLLGSSGSGKSSLMRAGVLPRLRRDRGNWIVLPPFRPRSEPLVEFAQAAAIALGAAENWKSIYDRIIGKEAKQELSDLARALRAKSGANEGYILISIDQGEELLRAGKQEADEFWRVLNIALGEQLPFIALLGLRSDYLGELQRISTLESSYEEVSLKPMPRERVREIIQGPARVAGIEVDDALVDAAMKDAATDDALPLLAFALREIYDQFANSRRLTINEYRVFGDEEEGISPLENAVRRRADEVLADAKAGPDELQALKEAFVPSLVRVNPEGDYVRRSAQITLLPEKARPLIERLAKARLLVIKGSIVEVAHEALLRKWPRLRNWLDEERDFLVSKDQLERDLGEWQKTSPDQQTDALLSGLKLTRARTWLIEKPSQLTDAERKFIQTSIAHHEAQTKQREKFRRYVQLGTIAATVVLAIVAGVAIWQRNLATAALSEAERSYAAVIEDAARNVAVIENLTDSPNITKQAAQQILNVSRDSFSKLLSGREDPATIRAQVLLLVALAKGYYAVGNLQASLESARAANMLALRAVAQNPTNMEWHIALAEKYRRLSDVLNSANEFDAALDARRSWNKIAGELAAKFPEDDARRLDLALSYQFMGDILRQLGRFDETLEAYQNGLSILIILNRTNPKNGIWKQGLAYNYERISDVLRAKGDFVGALAAAEAYLRGFQELIALDPTNTEWQRGFALSHERVGDTLRMKDDLAAALQAYTEFNSVAAELVHKDGSNTAWKRTLGFSYQRIGDILLLQREYDNALREYQQFLKIALQLEALDAMNAGLRHDVFQAHALIGDVYFATSRIDEALNEYRLFQSGVTQLYERNNSVPLWQRSVAVSYQRMGSALRAKAKFADAAEAFRKCLSIRGPATLANLAIVEPKDVAKDCGQQLDEITRNNAEAR